MAALALPFSSVLAADAPAPGVRAVAFSPDGKRLAASTGELEQAGTVTLWDTATWKRVWTHEEKAGIPAIAFAPDGKLLAVAGYDHTARLLDVATGKVKTMLPHPKEVRGLAFSNDGKRLATSCWDWTIRIWDVQNGTEQLTCKGHRDRIFTVAFSPDGRLLLSAGGNDGAKLWDAATGQEKHTWKHGGFYVSCAAFSPDGRSALTGGYDGTVRIWNVATGELRARFSGTFGVDNLAFSEPAQALAVCGNGRDVALFGLTFHDPTANDRNHIQTLLSRWDDDSYDLREATSREMLGIGFLAEPALRQAGQTSPSAEVRIRARRVRQQLLSKPRQHLRGHTAAVETAAFSPDGKLLTSGSKDGSVRLWDVASGKQTISLKPGPF
jgi:WD40 repeat protein